MYSNTSQLMQFPGLNPLWYQAKFAELQKTSRKGFLDDEAVKQELASVKHIYTLSILRMFGIFLGYLIPFLIGFFSVFCFGEALSWVLFASIAVDICFGAANFAYDRFCEKKIDEVLHSGRVKNQEEKIATSRQERVNRSSNKILCFPSVRESRSEKILGRLFLCAFSIIEGRKTLFPSQKTLRSLIFTCKA